MLVRSDDEEPAIAHVGDNPGRDIAAWRPPGIGLRAVAS
jgi:hypothetical protein